MNLDRFLGRRRKPGYDCAAFSRDVWAALTGKDLADTAGGLLAAQFAGRIAQGTRRAFRELQRPVSPCLVIMRRPGYSLHMGVYINGDVLHLSEHGSRLERLDSASRLFKTVQFAIC